MAARSHCPRARAEGRGGFVLIAVLLVVVLLAAVLLEFSYAARVNLYAADNAYRSRQALACAEAGVRVAQAALESGRPLDPSEAEGPLAGQERIPVGDGRCTVNVSEENGKLNVALLRDQQGRIVRSRVDQLLRLIDLLNAEYGTRAPIGYGVVPAIMDWTDEDSEVTVLPFIKRDNEGAESVYYAGLREPYACKNAPLDTLDELLLVRGMTSEIFDGRPAQDGTAARDGMRQFLTIYGDGKIDVNQAPALVLQSLSELVTSGVARAIVERRAHARFESAEDLMEVQGMSRQIFYAIRPHVTVAPARPCYTVTATGEAAGFSRTVRAVLETGEEAGAAKVLLRTEP